MQGDGSRLDPVALGATDADRLREAARAAARGDREAFAVIVTATQAPVLRLAARLMGQAEEGRDVAQEVYFAFWKVLPRLDLDRPLLPYLLRATVHKAARHLRRRPRFLALDGLAEVGREPAAPGGSVERIAEHQLRRALARLSRAERLAMALVSFDGYSAAEVARLTGRSDATVRQLLLRARRKLAKSIGGAR